VEPPARGPDEARRDAGLNLDFVQRGLILKIGSDEDRRCSMLEWSSCGTHEWILTPRTLSPPLDHVPAAMMRLPPVPNVETELIARAMLWLPHVGATLSLPQARLAAG